MQITRAMIDNIKKVIPELDKDGVRFVEIPDMGGYFVAHSSAAAPPQTKKIIDMGIGEVKYSVYVAVEE